MTRTGIHELTTDDEFRDAYPVLSQLRDLSTDEYRTLLERQREQGYRLFGSYDDGELVAVAGVAKRYNFYSDAHAFVYDLVTDEPRRGEGFGTDLLEHVHDWARAEDCAHVALESGLWRDRAHEFYEALGYEKFCYSFRKPLQS